jgi:hypothetical protein
VIPTGWSLEHQTLNRVCTFNSEKATSSTSVADLPKPRQPLGLQQSPSSRFFDRRGTKSSSSAQE